MNHGHGHRVQVGTAAPGVAADNCKGLVHTDSAFGRQHALGLLDYRTATKSPRSAD